MLRCGAIKIFMHPSNVAALSQSMWGDSNAFNHLNCINSPLLGAHSAGFSVRPLRQNYMFGIFEWLRRAYVMWKLWSDFRKLIKSSAHITQSICLRNRVDIGFSSAFPHQWRNWSHVCTLLNIRHSFERLAYNVTNPYPGPAPHIILYSVNYMRLDWIVHEINSREKAASNRDANR